MCGFQRINNGMVYIYIYIYIICEVIFRFRTLTLKFGAIKVVITINRYLNLKKLMKQRKNNNKSYLKN